MVNSIEQSVSGWMYVVGFIILETLVIEKWSLMHDLNIVQLSLKSRSRSVMVDSTEQSAFWQGCVASFIILETSVIEK